MTQKRWIILVSAVLLLAIGAGFVTLWPRISRVATRLRTYFSLPVYDETVVSNGDYNNLIFLHHSTGRNLIAEGDVRDLLTERGYQFWDHDFNHVGLTRPDGSTANAHYRIPGMWGRGDTDVAGLADLFSQPVTKPPDNAFGRLLQHEVIIVKSCYPNSAIHDDEMLRQFQKQYRQMRDTMDEHPNHLFIILTSPPLHPLGTNPEEASRARLIANWLTSDDFLSGHPNLFVFDFFDLLADPDSNTLRAAYQMTPSESQSHPNQLANEIIGPLFVEFVIRPSRPTEVVDTPAEVRRKRLMKIHQDKLILALINMFLLLTLCFTLWAQPSHQAKASESRSLPYEPNHYGLVYLYPHIDWGPDKREDMDMVLAGIRAKGVTTIIQTFSASLVGTPEADAWLIFLDAAAAAKIDVIAYLWPRTTYPVIDGPFKYDALRAFLDVVGDHPALIGYVGLHEPLEPPMGISADKLRSFYTEMKSYAPDLLLTHFMGNMAYAEEHRTDGWTFTDGMCDICLIWYYPFETIDGQPVYREDQVTAVVQSNIDLITERNLRARVWFLGQSFAAPGDHPRQLRMPVAAEMEALYLRVMQQPTHGLVWYPWNHTEVYSQVLSDPGLEEQQEMVGHIADRYFNLSRSYFPVVIYERN